ncbi:MAG TPA: hypothetical protein PLJ34_03330, partial [Hyphomicrobiales bacterium]|nr:hypothetical protein [Hyphomicrobiales bacterium]
AVAKPGVYCDGIEVKPSATLILTEGVYVIKGGMVKVGNLSTLKAEYAGLYLADNATFEFGEGSTIDLNGARSGPMAGLLMFEDPAASLGNSYKVSSRNAKNLTGTIYLPKGALVIQGVQASTTTTSTGTYTVADKSAYTAIVVNRLELKDGPNLVLNTNYNATDVPVPDGIAPIGRNIWIEK